MRIVQGNRLEWLCEQLAGQMGMGDAFAERWVVVPTKALKEWLQLEIAGKIGVCTGVRFLFLEEALAKLTGANIPTKEEIALRLELLGEETRLAHKLAAHFRDYSLYGGEMIGYWETGEAGHQPELWRKLYAQVDHWQRVLTEPQSWPDQLHLFAFAHLPPVVIRFLEKATLYLLTPCSHFWADLEKVEHPLLAQLGKLGRQLQWQIDLPEQEHYESDRSSRLRAVQAEMLTLEKEERPEDGSIRVYAANSRWREVQILREQLQDADQVVVMAPDISHYLPFIRAEFEGIPYRIEDVCEGDESFWLMIDLIEGRWEASKVLKFFEGVFKEDELRQIHRWVEEVGIYWGRDPAHRRELRGDEEGSWQEGIDKLIVSLATHRPVGDADLIEKLMETLESLKIEMPGKQTLAEWAAWIEALPCESPDSSQIKFLGRQLSGEMFEFESVRTLLENAPERRRTLGANQLNAITFCSLMPMRAVPAKVVALLGMDEESFPRPPKPKAHDELMDGDWRPTQADYDRYLFLETLLSARKQWIATYACVNEEDGLPQGPALPLMDLMHYAEIEAEKDPGLPLEEVEPRAELLFCGTESAPELFDLQELVAIASDPLRDYCKQVMGMAIKEEREIADEPDLSLDGLDLHRLAWEAADLALPPGPYRELAEAKVAQKRDKLQEAGPFRRIVLTEAVDREIGEMRPPLEVDGVRIVGELTHVTDQGLLVSGKGDGVAQVRNWPRLLVQAAVGCPALLWSEGKRWELVGDGPELLRRFVQHARECRRRPCPLTASQVAHLLTGRPATPIASPYAQRLRINEDPEKWRSHLEKVFKFALAAEKYPLKTCISLGQGKINGCR